MRKISRSVVSLAVALTMLGIVATSAQGSPNRNKYEWCHGNGSCYGTATVAKPQKLWSYRINGQPELHGTILKEHSLWHFRFENALDEACELRLTKLGKNFDGAEYCEGIEIERARWRRL